MKLPDRPKTQFFEILGLNFGLFMWAKPLKSELSDGLGINVYPPSLKLRRVIRQTSGIRRSSYPDTLQSVRTNPHSTTAKAVVFCGGG